MILRFNDIILLFIIADYCNLWHLWNENIFRRTLHHLQSNFDYRKKPLIHTIRNAISTDEILQLKGLIYTKDDGITNKSKLLSSVLGGHYSKRNTLYYEDFNKSSRSIMDEIGNKHIQLYNNLTGLDLRLGMSSFRGTILLYEGKESNFQFHYDTEEKTCFRSLFLIDKKGYIPPFTYFDTARQQIDINLDIGDGIFFRGTTTFHGVGPLSDDDSIRHVVGWQYCTYDTQKEHSICSEMRGATPLKIISFFLPGVLQYIISMELYHHTFRVKTNQKLYFRSFVLSLFNIYLYPYLASYIGSGRTSSWNQLLVFLLFCTIVNIHRPKNAVILYNYILFTEMIW